MKIQLRNYQKDLIAKFYNALMLEGHKKIMMQLPTGGGKTIIFSAIAKNFIERNKKILILAHRQELIIQAANKLKQFVDCEVGIIKSGYLQNTEALIQVASVQTLVNRLNDFSDFDLIVIDEAHHSTATSYRKILNNYPQAIQLGVTATPIRLDGTGFDDLFDVLISGVTVNALIENGYLSKFKLFACEPMSTQGVKSVAGDYSLSGLDKANNIKELSANVLESYSTHANGKSNVVFCINVNHSISIAERFNSVGISAYHLDGQTPSDERKEALKKFADGEIKVLTNCALFDEGLDIPGLECVQIAKPTKSLSRWLQMVGRALRPSEGKEHAVILDHTENWAIHGLPTRPRIWTLEGVEKNQKIKAQKDSDGTVKEVEELEIVESDRTLTEVDNSEQAVWQRTLNDVIETQIANQYKKGWVKHKLIKLKTPFYIWQQAGKQLGYHHGWAKHSYREQLEAEKLSV